MNRLKHHICYLAGPMEEVQDRGTEWRNYVTPILKDRYGCGVFNPCNKPLLKNGHSSINENDPGYLKAREVCIENKDLVGMQSIMKQIVRDDLRMVDLSSFVICYINNEIHMAGSYHEISEAIGQRKPVLSVIKNGKHNLPKWWFGVMPTSLLFSDFDEMFDYLDEINSSENIDTLNGRWKFFDYDKVY